MPKAGKHPAHPCPTLLSLFVAMQATEATPRPAILSSVILGLGVSPMRRREFIALVGSSVAGGPLAARAQRPDRVRRIGALMGFAESDPQWNARLAAFRAALQELGWTDGRSVLINTQWTNADPDPSAAAAELVALSPDAIFACPHTAAAALHRQTRTIPIVGRSGECGVRSKLRTAGRHCHRFPDV